MDWLRHYEDMARRFHRETGFMAPGKDVAAAMNPGADYGEKRLAAWREWFSLREAEAWSMWHTAFGWTDAD